MSPPDKNWRSSRGAAPVVIPAESDFEGQPGAEETCHAAEDVWRRQQKQHTHVVIAKIISDVEPVQRDAFVRWTKGFNVRWKGFIS